MDTIKYVKKQKHNSKHIFKYYVQRRNVDKSPYPGDSIIFDFTKFIIAEISLSTNKEIIFTVVPSPDTIYPKLIDFLRNYDLYDIPIRIANSFDFSTSSIIEFKRDLISNKFNHIHSKLVQKSKFDRHQTKLWLI